MAAGDAGRYVVSFMRIALLFAGLLLLSVSSCSVQPRSDIPSPLGPDRDIEHKLRSILPEGWSLATHEDTFTLLRGEKVWLYVQVGWDVRGESFEESVKRYGSLENYRIILRFAPRLSASEFEKLRLEREPFARVLNEGGRSKSEWGKAVEEFYKHRVPVYVTDNYSVFAEKSDDYPVKIYPESVTAECKRVLASLDALFPRYEKSAGRHGNF